jgi:hypothetical protein
MNLSPRLVVAFVGGDRPRHAGGCALLELDVEQRHELARVGEIGVPGISHREY